MGRSRYTVRPTTPVIGTPFLSAEHAWLWAAHAVRFDEPGAHLTSNHATLKRPCEPRDIIFLACRLRREGDMTGLEFGTLCRFGAKDRPPDEREEAEVRDCMFWTHALDKLEPALIQKGIVAQPYSEAGEVSIHQKRNKK